MAKKVISHKEDKLLTDKELETLLSKKVKAFTAAMKKEGKKYGKILDVAVLVREADK